MMRFKQSPEPHPGMCAPGNENKIYCTPASASGNTLIMAVRRRDSRQSRCIKVFALSLSRKDEAARPTAIVSMRWLARRARLQMPLGKTFLLPALRLWSPIAFGMGLVWSSPLPPRGRRPTRLNSSSRAWFDAPREALVDVLHRSGRA
jgi:hypothetical protein